MRENLLFIIPHDLGKHNSVYGAATHTPCLQEFSRTATCFTNALAAAPTCSPSRAALMTGLYPHQSGMTGLTHLGFRLTRPERHLSAVLSQAGYRTVLSGVQHEAPHHNDLGYAEYIGGDADAPFADNFDPLRWDRQNTQACALFLQSSAADSRSPWFLSLGLFLPHRPFIAADSPSAAGAVPDGLPPTEAVEDDFASFQASVTEMDRNIGEVLSALESSGQNETTMVVICTDHGIDFPRYKNTLSDGGLAVTLLTRAPGQRKARVSSSLVSLVDVYPSILNVLGIDLPEDIHESDARCVPEISDDATSHDRAYAFSEINYHVSYQPERCVSTTRYRLRKRYHEFAQVLPNIGDSPTKDAVYREHVPFGIEMSPGEPVSSITLSDRWYDPLQNVNLRSLNQLKPVAHELEAALCDWMEITQDPLLIGAVSAPANSAVASEELYSSHSADTIRTQELLGS